MPVYEKEKMARILIGTASAAVATSAWIAFCGYQWSWESFTRLHDIKTAGLPPRVSLLPTISARETAADLFVCQLSTNDATQKKDLGNVSESFDRGDFDTKTVAGAIEYIISYAKEIWGGPVVFYTNPQYNSPGYAAMVELLGAIQQKWDIAVIDMWNDADFNAITQEQRELYLADAIHPNKAVYLKWWMPYMENAIYEVIGKER